MIINHNLASNNTLRQMSVNESTTQKSLAKLSSGFKINSAADDAAGLSISEKMRGQISGLNKASSNAQDGISMVSTAEGSLAETTSILQRMRELAVQASSDTNTTIDRGAMQTEMNQLTSEVNRIGNTTSFNTQKLLNGGGQAATVTNNSASLKVSPALSGGVGNGTMVQQSLAYTLTEALTDDVGREAANGKTIDFTFGDKTVSLTLNNGLDTAHSTATQIGISDVSTAAELGDAITAALTETLKADKSIADNYSVSNVGAVLTIAADAYAFSRGKATGTDAGINSKINMQTSITYTEAATAGQGSNATSQIDFTGKTAADLVGNTLIIDDKQIAFYDSTNGQYTGSAEFSVDLKGAANEEAIVDRIVSELYNSTGGADIQGGHSAADGASYLANVDAVKDPNNSKQLTLIAHTGGAAGNALTIQYDAPVAVSNFVGSDKLEGDGVVSAKGLTDGQQTVKVTYNAASITGQTSTLAAAISVSVSASTNFDSGTYRLTNAAGATAGDVQLQKLGDDGTTWGAVNGYEDITLTSGADKTFGDITVNANTAANFTIGAEGTDVVQFTVNKQGYSAALKEAGSDLYGAAVAVRSGDTSVGLKAEDGVGQVTVDVGAIKDLAVGANTTFTFNTKPAEEGTAVVGGRFEAKLQIGANTGESMTVQIDDMRSQALGISGNAAGATVMASNGSKASLVAVKSASNGSDNNNIEFTLDLSKSDKATAAISVIDDAIAKVSAQRSNLGAVQNRLEHTINNLGTSSQNITTAEANIRDVDMAKEMTNFTKNNILQQASQAMLSQANQQAQGVLQLLR